MVVDSIDFSENDSPKYIEVLFHRHAGILPVLQRQEPPLGKPHLHSSIFSTSVC